MNSQNNSLNKRQDAILAFVEHAKSARSGEVLEHIRSSMGGITRVTIARDLAKLVAAGLLLREGVGRNTQYLFPNRQTQNTIQSIKTIARPILRQSGVARSYLFGSYARGEATGASDIDLLVEFAEDDKSLFDLIRLKHQLEDTLGVTVDINTSAAVYPPLRSIIDREKIQIL